MVGSALYTLASLTTRAQSILEARTRTTLKTVKFERGSKFSVTISDQHGLRIYRSPGETGTLQFEMRTLGPL